MKRILLLVVLVTMCVTAMQAQWVTDSEKNTLLSPNRVGSCVSPKVAKTSDGKMFVSWISFEGSDESRLKSYTKLQLLDRDGNPLWEEGGIYVSRHSGASYTTDYSLATTPDGCAVIAFSDSRYNLETNLDFAPHVYKIDQDKNYLWGLDGIKIPCKSHQGMRPRIGVTNAGSVYVGYSDAINGLFSMQRISADGELEWGENLELPGMMGNFIATGEDDILLTWFGGGLTVQRFDPYGEAVWTKPVVIEGQYLNGKVEPQVVSDGLGGFVVCYGRTVSLSEIYVCIQRVSADGELMMGLESVTTGEKGYLHAAGDIGVDVENQEIICQWSRKIGETETHMVNRYDFFGEPLWGEQGINLKENWMFGFYPGGIAVLDEQQSILVYADYQRFQTKNKIMAKRLDKHGELIWETEVCSNLDYKIGTNVCQYDDQIVTIWQTSKGVGGDVFGQNISLDGKLGIVTSGIEEMISNPKQNDIYYDGKNINLKWAKYAGSAVDLQIYDLVGTSVYSVKMNIEDEENVIPLTLPQGVYLIHLLCNGEENVRKIMVK